VKPARDRVRPIISRLKRRYPEARCSLDYRTPLELLVATILSAQCTDERVNLVTPVLFARYRTAWDYGDANPEELETIIKSTGFYRNKTKSLIGMGRALAERHGGDVPRTMAELTAVPGVGRKTANVVLGNAFGLNQGVVVDTHVARISQRLGFTRHPEPGKIEPDLMALIPRKEWTLFPHLMIHHGRAICQARKPRCEICPVNDLCPFPGKAVGRKAVTGGHRRS
jgi:endonuclease-3